MDQKEKEDKHIEFLIEELEGLTIENQLDYLENDDFEYKYYQSTMYTNCPDPLTDVYFKDWNKNPRWSYWVMKRYARFLLELEKKNPKNVQRFESNIRERFIESELKDIQNEYEYAWNLYEQKQFDILDHHPNNYRYYREIETVRVIMDNYYKENYLHVPWGSPAGQKYFRHFLWKEYLEERISPRKMQTNELNSGELLDKFYSGAFEKLCNSLNGKINPATKIWSDEEKGNKGYLASLLKHIHTKGYLQKKFTHNEIFDFCDKILKHPIGIDTIKKARINDFDFSFIPPFKNT